MSDASGNLIYSFDPIFDENSRVLVLGTMASPASLREGMYYGHPQNAFWRILSDITGDVLPRSNEEKRAFLLRHQIALWDTLRSCEREGALDADIRNRTPNDVRSLLVRCASIRAVFLNGSAALQFYKRYHAQSISLPFFGLPSTSPANARMNYPVKREKWMAILEYL